MSFQTQMMQKLDEMKRDSDRLSELAGKGIISIRLKEYLGQLQIIDFVRAEAKHFAQEGDLNAVGEVLADAKLASEAVYAIYVEPLLMAKKIKIGERLPTFIQGLRDGARELYEEAVSQAERRLQLA